MTNQIFPSPHIISVCLLVKSSIIESFGRPVGCLSVLRFPKNYSGPWPVFVVVSLCAINPVPITYHHHDVVDSFQHVLVLVKKCRFIGGPYTMVDLIFLMPLQERREI